MCLSSQHSPARVRFLRPRGGFRRTDHVSLHAFDVELIFQADGQTVQGTNWRLMLRKVCVEAFGGLDGRIEEDFMQTTDLAGSLAMNPSVAGRYKNALTS